MQHRSKPPLMDVVTKPGRPPMRPPLDRAVVRPRPQGAYGERSTATSHLHQDTVSPFNPEGPRGGSAGSARPWLVGALVVGAVILTGAVVLSVMFTGATVTVVPRTYESTIDSVASITPEAAEGTLRYTQLSVEATKEKSIESSGEAQVEERARGTLTIYNAHSSAAQRLIKDTRFESPDGKIFRIREEVLVPGSKTVGGKTVPGELAVTVYAEVPGEAYNIAPTKFTIPGFEGRPQFKTITAESLEPFTGGFKGTKRVVDAATAQAARTSLEQELEAELEQQLRSRNDEEGLVYVDGSATFTIEQLPDEDGLDDTVLVALRGTATGFSVSPADFARFLAHQVVPAYDGEDVTLTSLKEVSIARAAGTLGTDADERVDVSIKGRVALVWEFDEIRLRDDLAGKTTSIMDMPPDQTVLGKYPGIQSAQAVVKPFWKGTFPRESQDIKIVTVLDS